MSDNQVSNFFRDHFGWLITIATILVAISVAWGINKASINEIEVNAKDIKALREADNKHNTGFKTLSLRMDNQDEKLNLILDRLNEQITTAQKERENMRNDIRKLDKNVDRLIYFNEANKSKNK